MFTDHTSMEGLYFDSSITTPFHFISVSGLSEQPSNPVGGLRYYNGQFERGVYYLKQLGVDYFITYSDTKFQEALNSRNLDFIDKVSPKNRATNGELGLLYIFSGVSNCKILPLFIIAIKSPINIASSGS